MPRPSRLSRRSFVSALAAIPALLWARRASALVPALARHPTPGPGRPIQASPTPVAGESAPDASAPAQRSKFLSLRSPECGWIAPGRVVGASGIARVKFRASLLILLGEPSDWRIRGLWVNDRLASGTEGLSGERCGTSQTSPSFPGIDVEVGDEIRVEAEFAGPGERGLWGGGMLTYWSPPRSDEDLRDQVLSGFRDPPSWKKEWVEEFTEGYRAFRARCAETAIRMSDAEAALHVPEYQRWRDLARAGLVG